MIEHDGELDETGATITRREIREWFVIEIKRRASFRRIWRHELRAERGGEGDEKYDDQRDNADLQETGEHETL
jgi:hypothetical protein